MKKILFILLAVLVTAGLHAQNCKGYYYLTNNAEIQITLFNAKGAKAGTQTWKISSVTKDGSGFRSTVNTSMKDDNGKEIAKSSGVYKCDGGKLMADMRMSIPQDENQSAPAADAKVTNAYLEYPVDMKEGMQLPDALLEMDVNTSGIASASSFEMKNRHVVSKEKVTTAAGSWDAYKIEYDAVMKVSMGGLNIPKNMKAVEWFVPNFGVVKSESYNKKGKLKGSSLLTAIN